jgi:hypothetical protein
VAGSDDGDWLYRLRRGRNPTDILLAQKMTRTYDAAFFRADPLLGFYPVAFADAISYIGWCL